MIKGMTGFGSAQVSVGKVKCAIEVKSQNHRYLDIVYYLPMGFSSVENNIRQLISRAIQRGRVTVSVRILEKPSAQLTFHQEIVKEYLRHAKQLKKEFGLKNDLTLSDLVGLPGVAEAKEAFVDAQRLWPALEKRLKHALDGLVAMRTREGKSLRADMSGVLKRMRAEVKTIQSRARNLLRDKKKTLANDEFMSYQKSNDVNEEIARLVHYVEEFGLHLKSSASVGKKLDFIAQEMQRETNTIGSKIQDKVVTRSVIALKSKIEKLREQAQNVE